MGAIIAENTCKTHSLRFFGIFFTLIVGWWLFAQPVFAASATHQAYVTVQSGDTLYSLFKKEHISSKTLATILRQPVAATNLKRLHLNQRMRFSFDAKNNLESLAVSLSRSKTLFIFRAGSRFIARVENGSFRSPATPKSTVKVVKAVPVKKKTPPPKKIIPVKKVEKAPHPPVVKAKPEAKKTVSKPTIKTITTKKLSPPPTIPAFKYNGMIIHHSFYVDAKKQEIPNTIIAQVIHIFSLQVNFKNTHVGDKLLVAYDNNNDVVVAEFIQGSRTYTAIRYVNAQGVVEYFTPEGDSMKKAFNRFPVKYTHINSLFNMHRMHPVSHVVRPHTGVDLAAPIGTPVYSIGDGRVSFIGWEGAYGNIVKVQHNDKYSSMYAHLLRFAPGLSKGAYVKRGQLIGYLGQTGNATGPHVHFEVRVYNVPVNPLTVPLPQASSVPASQIKTFRLKAQNLLNALDYYLKTQLKS